MVEKLTPPKYHDKLKRISTSTRLVFSHLRLSRQGGSGAISKRKSKTISRDYCIKHATFVVDVLAGQRRLPGRPGESLAMNRWRQMRQPSVSVPTQNHKMVIGREQTR